MDFLSRMAVWVFWRIIGGGRSMMGSKSWWCIFGSIGGIFGRMTRVGIWRSFCWFVNFQWRLQGRCVVLEKLLLIDIFMTILSYTSVYGSSSHFSNCWTSLQLTVSIQCKGSYCHALVALSFTLSPLWLGVYIYSNFDINLWWWKMGMFVALKFVGGLMIMIYAPECDGTMVTCWKKVWWVHECCFLSFFFANFHHHPHPISLHPQ